MLANGLATFQWALPKHLLFWPGVAEFGQLSVGFVAQFVAIRFVESCKGFVDPLHFLKEGESLILWRCINTQDSLKIKAVYGMQTMEFPWRCCALSSPRGIRKNHKTSFHNPIHDKRMEQTVCMGNCVISSWSRKAEGFLIWVLLETQRIKRSTGDVDKQMSK